MLPILPGIQELLNVMRSDVPEYIINADLLTPSEVLYECHVINTSNAKKASHTIPKEDSMQRIGDTLNYEILARPAASNSHSSLNSSLKILPKLNNVVPTPKTNCNSLTARSKSNSTTAMLYHVLKPNTSFTTGDFISSEIEPKSLKVIPPAPTSNTDSFKTSSKIPRQDNISLAGSKSTHPNSGLNPLQCSNDSSTLCHFLNSEINKTSSKPDNTAPRSQIPKPSQSIKRRSSTKPVTKSKKNRINRISSKPSSAEVMSRVSESKVSCDGGLNDVKVTLEREALWKLFYDQGNEMIVSKQGRPMFPTLDLEVSGLNAQEMYKVSVNFVCVDKHRYRFYPSLSAWQQKINDKHQFKIEPATCVAHPESPASGQFWSQKLLSFNHLRLTNRPSKAKNMIFTQTMRKHRIELVVTMLRCARCRAQHTRHIDIPLTEFMAVSSYYNTNVTQLKITHNPAAKLKCVNRQRKRKICDRNSPEKVTRGQSKKQKIDDNVLDSDCPSLSAVLATPVSSSVSTHVTVTDVGTLSTITSTQQSTVADFSTTSSSILPSTSCSKLSTVLPFVPQSIPSGASDSKLSSMSNQATITSTSSIKPTVMRPYESLSTTTYPQGHVVMCAGNASKTNTVYSCQTTKPTAQVQSDDDIHHYINIYLSPFQTSEKLDEDFDSSIFDELDNINYIADKSDSFDNFKIQHNFNIQHLPLCYERC